MLRRIHAAGNRRWRDERCKPVAVTDLLRCLPARANLDVDCWLPARPTGTAQPPRWSARSSAERHPHLELVPCLAEWSARIAMIGARADVLASGSETARGTSVGQQAGAKLLPRQPSPVLSGRAYGRHLLTTNRNLRGFALIQWHSARRENTTRCGRECVGHSSAAKAAGSPV